MAFAHKNPAERVTRIVIRPPINGYLLVLLFPPVGETGDEERARHPFQLATTLIAIYERPYCAEAYFHAQPWLAGWREGGWVGD